MHQYSPVAQGGRGGTRQRDLGLDYIKGTRRDVLGLLRRHGTVTAAGLTEPLGISVSGARQALATLEYDGLIEHRFVPDGPGRPRKVFKLTAAGDRVFLSDSRDLAEMAIELIAQGSAPNNLEAVARGYFAKRLRFRRATDTTVAEQAREAAATFSEGGFFGEAEDAGTHGALICLYACPIAEIARRFPVFCEVEQELLGEQVRGLDLRRIAHIPAGDEACVYRLAVARANSAGVRAAESDASAAK